MTVEFILYGRENCELCDQANVLMQSLIADHDAECHLVKIDDDAELEHRYSARLPVLEFQGQEICETNINKDIVLGLLNGRREH